MAGTIPRAVLQVVETASQREATELALAALAEAVRVISQAATGTGDIDQTFSLQRHSRLVFVRCHFAGGAGFSELRIDVDSMVGSAYDTGLFTVRVAGADHDVNFRLTNAETRLPSPWALQPGDAVRVQWSNPDPGNTTWGLEVGLAPA